MPTAKKTVTKRKTAKKAAPLSRRAANTKTAKSGTKRTARSPKRNAGKKHARIVND